MNVTVVDQVATTTVEQSFRNHTSRPLEATYLFPVPAGAGTADAILAETVAVADIGGG